MLVVSGDWVSMGFGADADNHELSCRACLVLEGMLLPSGRLHDFMPGIIFSKIWPSYSLNKNPPAKQRVDFIV